MLFNEPKLLKCNRSTRQQTPPRCFSALQRAEIAEMYIAYLTTRASNSSFSALQRAEIAEIRDSVIERTRFGLCFSALQRAEIAEIARTGGAASASSGFSALQRAEIAEIALLVLVRQRSGCFSALQRAEIAEMRLRFARLAVISQFQCSSTSRNC